MTAPPEPALRAASAQTAASVSDADLDTMSGAGANTGGAGAAGRAARETSTAGSSVRTLTNTAATARSGRSWDGESNRYNKIIRHPACGCIAKGSCRSERRRPARAEGPWRVWRERSQPKLHGDQSPPLVSAGPGQWGAHAHGHPDYRFRYTEPLSSKRRSLGWGKHCAPDRVFANLQGRAGRRAPLPHRVGVGRSRSDMALSRRCHRPNEPILFRRAWVPLKSHRAI